jgi:hypothetical protein
MSVIPDEMKQPRPPTRRSASAKQCQHYARACGRASGARGAPVKNLQRVSASHIASNAVPQATYGWLMTGYMAWNAGMGPSFSWRTPGAESMAPPAAAAKSLSACSVPALWIESSETARSGIVNRKRKPTRTICQVVSALAVKYAPASSEGARGAGDGTYVQSMEGTQAAVRGRVDAAGFDAREEAREHEQYAQEA